MVYLYFPHKRVYKIIDSDFTMYVGRDTMMYCVTYDIVMSQMDYIKQHLPRLLRMIDEIKKNDFS